jgi:hypothetical protein
MPGFLADTAMIEGIMAPRRTGGVTVAYFDVVAFVSKLEGMGVKLTAVPLADGTLRISRWITLAAAEHATQIQDLWASAIGENQAHIDLLATHLSRATPAPSSAMKAPDGISSAAAPAKSRSPLGPERQAAHQ